MRRLTRCSATRDCEWQNGPDRSFAPIRAAGGQNVGQLGVQPPWRRRNTIAGLAARGGKSMLSACGFFAAPRRSRTSWPRHSRRRSESSTRAGTSRGRLGQAGFPRRLGWARGQLLTGLRRSRGHCAYDLNRIGAANGLVEGQTLGHHITGEAMLGRRVRAF